MKVSTRVLILVGLAIAVALVMFVAPFANAHPDGLERVAIDHRLAAGIGAEAGEHDLGSSPLADYSVSGVDNSAMSTALAGIVGVAVVFGVGCAMFAATKRFGSR